MRFMRSFKLYFLVIVSASTLAFAGGMEGGGGKGVVCRDSAGHIQSVELLDLWETKNIRHEQIIPSLGSASSDLKSAINRAKNIFTEEDITRPDGTIIKADTEIIEELTFIAFGVIDPSKNFENVERVRGVNLPISNDSYEGNLTLNPNCRIEQVATFSHGWGHDSHWVVNLDLTDKMDNINLAAFGLHEAVYQYLDTYSEETNSLRVRRSVGFVMSGKEFSDIKNKLKSPYIKCSANDIAKEIGVSPVDPHYTYLNRTLTGFVYFTQDPNIIVPKITMVVDKIRSSRLIDFATPSLISNINLNTTVPEFFNNLQKSKMQIKIQAFGNPNDIEFNSEVDFDFLSSSGVVSKIKSTGAGLNPAPVSNLTCELIN